MDLDIQTKGTIVIIKINDGRIDVATMMHIKEEMIALLGKGRRDFIIQGMAFLAEDSLTTLVSTWKLAYENNGSLRFCEVPSYLIDMFGNLNKVFEFYPTLQEALDSFAGVNSDPVLASENEHVESNLKRSLLLGARWVQDYFEGSDVEQGKMLTVIASRLPWAYYCVVTMQKDTFSPLSKLTRSLHSHINYKDVPDEILGYTTYIYRCDKNGLVKSQDEPIYEQDYTDINKAIKGHKDTVKKFSKGATVYSPSGSRVD